MTATAEKLHATVDELEVSMENLAMEVADLIRYEETSTNEEAIKDVQDAQSNLTQAIQILMDFYMKFGQAVHLTQQSLLSEDWAIESLTTDIRWEVPISSALYK